MRPFLRWAGSKKWLIQKNYRITLERGSKYVEPFLGSGSMFFSVLPGNSILTDSNPHLINCFKAMRDETAELFSVYQNLIASHSDHQYYTIRDRLQVSGTSAAADFLYLNRTCFNGLFRVNLSGSFNVPIGSKIGKPFSTYDFEQWSIGLAGADITCSDFEETINLSLPGDMMFVDPPYTVAHNKNGFIEYNEKIFSWGDQVRLAESLDKASSRGVDFLLTNADHSSVRELYKAKYNLESVSRRSVVAGDVRKRASVSELLISTRKLETESRFSVVA